MPAPEDSACGLRGRGAGERAQAQSRLWGSSVSQALPGLSTATVPWPLRKSQITGDGQACAPRAAGAPRRATALPAHQHQPQHPAPSLPVSDSSMPEAAEQGGLSREDPGEACTRALVGLASHLQGPWAGNPAPGPSAGSALTPPLSPVLLLARVCVCVCVCWSLEAAHPREGAWEAPPGGCWGGSGQRELPRPDPHLSLWVSWGQEHQALPSTTKRKALSR